MIQNYLTIAWRSLVRNGTFYFINISGLSVGLTCCLLIASYLTFELGYDRYPDKAGQIYRVELHVTGNGTVADYPMTDWGVGPGIKNAYPEVKNYTRLTHSFQPYLHYKDVVFKEERLAAVDSNFFRFFSIPLTVGDGRTALVRPNSIVVTRAFAEKYFGAEDPIGKALSFGPQGEFKVTGLIEKIPDQTHFHFDAFISMSTYGAIRESWSNIGIFTYLTLNEHADPNALQAKFPDLVERFVVPEVQQDMGVSQAEAMKSVNTFIIALRPLSAIHLYSHTAEELDANGDIKYIYIFGALATFILLLACVNFTNLSTASSSRRAREVGVRKVMGSTQSQLIVQFLTESVLLAAFAMVLAYGLIYLFLPAFRDLTGRPIPFSFFVQSTVLLSSLGSLVVVGILSGLYPALFLSSFNTIGVLKGTASAVPGSRDRLRGGLVVFQFTISMIMITSTLIVYQQLSFMQNKKLGYDNEQVLVVQDSRMLGPSEKSFKELLLKDSRVTASTIASGLPGDKNIDGTQAYPKDKSAQENGAEIHINIYHVDYDYLSTLGIPVKSGRNLSLDFPSDSSAIVINETAAREFGWDPDNATGNSVVMSGQREYHVVGVVGDFNYLSVRQKIAPLVMMLSRNRGSIAVKIRANDIKGFLEDVRKQWNGFGTGTPFSYSFLDQRFSAFYFAEERTGQIFGVFAVIALLIAGLGLFGLSTYTADQRSREIGIRKVLGASARQVLFMLSKDFLLLVLIAFIIAVPIAAWAMDRWLEDFAYRVSIGWQVFALAAALALLIAFASMCVQSVRAAVRNPVDSLKAE